MALNSFTSWKHTREVLEEFNKLLSCAKCYNTPSSPKRYTICGHFFCSNCIGDNDQCPKCSSPAKPSEVQLDHTMANLIKCCGTISELIGQPTKYIEGTKKPMEVTVDSKLQNKGNQSKVTANLKRINKPNEKGETRLHIACTKGKGKGTGHIEEVKRLLEQGADPNTKDYNGWTPLQEVVGYKYHEICSILLEHGALPNTPGYENKTPLHEAVINDDHKMARLLLRYHADKDARDSEGKTPLDYQQSVEMEQILSADCPVDETFNKTMENILDQSFAQHEAIVFGLHLTRDNRTLLSQMADKYKVKVVTSFNSVVTHVIVECNRPNVACLTYDILLVILHGKWLLDSEWIRLCTESMMDLSSIELGPFEVLGTTGVPISCAPTRARENAQKQNPRLFNGCHFYFALKPNTPYYMEKVEFTKKSLQRLITEGGGEVMSREPDPETIQAEKLIVPFHISRNPEHALYRCTHYIIYVLGKEEPLMKYNMPHIKSLPLIWLIESIERFELLDPAFLGLT